MQPTDAATTAPADPASTAAALTAVPMLPQQQLDLLALVTQLGIMVRDLKAENAALRTRLDQVTDDVAATTGEFDQRLSLAEAKGAVAAAMGAAKPADPPTPVTDKKPVALRAGPLTKAAARTSRPASPHYRVQAGSPGLVILAALDTGPGEPSALQASVGNPVPGFGCICSITQHGTAWIVETEGGTIQ